MAATQNRESVDIAKEGVTAAYNALAMYNDMINQIIPWDTFRETIRKLKDAEQQYSNQAAGLIGKIQTLMLNSNDHYDSSMESVYRWCKMAVPVLGQYMTLFAKTTEPRVAEAQKVLLLKVLNEGSDAMSAAISKLEESKSSFNKASGELSKLKITLDNDFSKGSEYFVSQIRKTRAEAYGGAAAGVLFFGPIGLVISYGIAVGITEGELVPKLEKAFDVTRKQFVDLLNTVKNAQMSITNAKTAISAEIRVIGKMSAKIKETKTFATTWALVPEFMFDDLKRSTTELIAMCNKFIVCKDGGWF